MDSKRFSPVSIALFMTGLLAACSGSADDSSPIGDEPEVVADKKAGKPEKQEGQQGPGLPKPTPHEVDKTFTLTTATGEIPLALGDKVSVPIIVARGADQQDPIIVSVSDLPSGVSAAPLTLSSSERSGEVVLAASSSAKSGTSSITVRALAGTVEKTATLSLNVQKSSSGSETTIWCSELLRCCNQMGAFVERAACVANSAIGKQDACKIHLLAYIAKGDCYVSVPNP